MIFLDNPCDLVAYILISEDLYFLRLLISWKLQFYFMFIENEINTHIYIHFRKSYCCIRFYKCNLAQKMKFSLKDFFSKCDQIRSFLRIWSHLQKKSFMKNFIFCVVLYLTTGQISHGKFIACVQIRFKCLFVD